MNIDMELAAYEQMLLDMEDLSCADPFDLVAAHEEELGEPLALTVKPSINH